MLHGKYASRVRRSRQSRTVSQLAEALEPRRLLASTVTGAFDIADIPVFRPTSTELADVKSGPMANAGSRLIDLYRNYRHAVVAHENFVNTDGYLSVHDGKVGVTLRIRTDDLAKYTRGLEKGYDFEPSAFAEEFSLVQGYLPFNWLRTIAARKDVAQIWPILKPVTSQQGSAGNQADAALGADKVRQDFFLDGTGVKVGVISDSFNQFQGGYNDSIGTGDLPADVQILADGFFFDTDEGRGMAELIHDIVPSAKLAFATANGGQEGFAKNIKALQNAGASVIVDDVKYLDEPYFQEGVIDAAVRAHVNAGGTYLTSAGNNGSSGFEQRARYTTQQGISYIDFDPSMAAATRMSLTVSVGGFVCFQWDDPYNGVTGSASTDLDIRFYQGNALKAEGIDDNLATGRPVEFLDLDPGVYQIEIRVAQEKPGTSRPTRIRLTGTVGMEDFQFTGSRASVIGHQASGAAISVGAVPFFNSPPFSSLTPIRNEFFSARGGATYTRDPNGKKLNFPQTPQTPQISGIDGVNTSFFGTDIPQDGDIQPNFFGTSAASPNVGAVVAMIKQADPTATQTEILDALEATARPLNGSDKGDWDPFGGHGLVDALSSVPVFIGPPSVAINRIAPDPRGTTVNNVTIKFNQFVNGFTRSDLVLTRDGAKTNLLTGSQTLATSDNITWTLNNLASVTTTPGVYKIYLNASFAGITNVIDTPLAVSAHDVWTKTVPPPRPAVVNNFSAAPISSSTVQLRWDNNNTTEYEYYVQQSTSSNFSGGVRGFHLPLDSTAYLATGLAAGTRYYFRVRAVNTTRPGTYATADPVLTLVSGEIVMDNDSAGVKVTGFWGSSTSGGDFIGSDYLQDGNSGKGTKSVRYELPIEGDGQYYVYAHWPKSSNRATNVPFDIDFGPTAASTRTILVDQRNRGGPGWTLIGGPFQMNRGTRAAVRIRNADTNGIVVADAIRILPIGPIAPLGLRSSAIVSAPPLPQQRDEVQDLLDESLL